VWGLGVSLVGELLLLTSGSFGSSDGWGTSIMSVFYSNESQYVVGEC
jgi:hypothetical protein